MIDDDTEIIHSIWASVAADRGLKIKMFATPEEFLSAAGTIEKRSPVYVDVSLGNGINGTAVAQTIHALGFTEINLATGYDVESIAVPHFIRRVVGKDFPESLE